jgi:hypothetical protein
VHREPADVHPDDRGSVLLGLRARGGELDPAGLAAPADLDLGLDHDRVAELLGGRGGVGGGGRVAPVGNGHAVLGEQLFALVFE